MVRIPDIPIRAGCKNVLLIDEAVKDACIFSTSTNADTFNISYNSTSRTNDKVRILEILRQLGGGIERFGFVFEMSTQSPKLDSAPFFTKADISTPSSSATTPATYSENFAFLLGAIREFSIKRIDFLACDTLKERGWKKFYDILVKETGVIVGASNDATGNIKSGGDWVMETTNQDIELVYFTKSIKYYKYVLGNGNGFVCVIKENNNIYGEGNITNGQLGLGLNPYYMTLTDRTKFLTGSAIQVACGLRHSFIIMSDGIVYGFGANEYGQLGTVDNNDYHTLTAMLLPSGKTAQGIVCGNAHTIVSMTDGTVYAIGDNHMGQLGLGDTDTRSTLTEMTFPAGKIAQKFACGYVNTIVTMSDGTVYGTGDNASGQLGLGDQISRSALTEIPLPVGKTAQNVACGQDYAVILMTDGSVYAAGSNYAGQLGVGDINDRSTLTEMQPLIGKSAQGIVCGNAHTIVLMTDGTLYGTGSNGDGQLGLLVDTDNRNTLTHIDTDGGTPQHIACGYHTVIQMADGTVFSTGYNNNGQLGLGDLNSRSIITEMTIPGGKTVQKIDCGDAYIIAVMTDGSVYATGYNLNGQLGLGDTIDRLTLTEISVPAPLVALSVQQIAASFAHTMILMSDGALYGCGYNGYGQLGFDYFPYPNPASVPIPYGKAVQSVACGYYHTVVLMTDGSVYTTGGNYAGQLGTGDTDYRTILTAITIPDSKTAQYIACGFEYTTVMMTDGSVYATGSNNSGQLGVGDTSDRLSLTAMTLPDGKTVQSVACGYYHTVVIMTDESVYATGSNNSGQLGTGDTDYRTILTAITIPDSKTAQMIACGEGHTVILMADLTVYGCGYNQFGSLGIGTFESPILTLIAMTIPDGKTAESIDCGSNHTIVLMSDGSVYSTGNNVGGRLGTGNFANIATLSAMALPNGKLGENVICGYDYTIVVMTDGSVFSAGHNNNGQLGYGLATSENSVVKKMIMIENKTPQNVFCGDSHTIVLMTDGTVYGTGYNVDGELGLGDTINRFNLTEIIIPDSKSVQHISCGSSHTAILMTDGSVYVFGYNSEGQLGTGDTNNRSTPTAMILPSGKIAQDVSCGERFTIVLMTDGSIYGTGNNEYAPLGTGDLDSRITLTTAMTIPNGKSAKGIVCTTDTTVIIMTDGTIYGCGDNYLGELGTGTYDDYLLTLTEMILPVGKTAQTVNCGQYYTIVLMTDGTLYGTGSNSDTQLGLGPTANEKYNTLTEIAIPDGKTIANIYCTLRTTVILMTDGSVYECGVSASNDYIHTLQQNIMLNNTAYLASSYFIESQTPPTSHWASGIDQPYALVAHDPYMYVGRRGAGLGIDRYNLSDGSLDTEYWVNGATSNMFNIASMAVDGSYMYVVASVTAENPPEDPTNIFKISLADASIASNSWVPDIFLVGNIAIYGAFMYAVHYSNGIIRKISLADGIVVNASFATVSVIGDTQNIIMNIDDAGMYMYVQRGLGRISKIAMSDGSIVDADWINIATGPMLLTDGFVLYGPFIYVTSTSSGDIEQISLVSREIVTAPWASQADWGTAETSRMAMTVFGSSLYAARTDTGVIDKFALPAVSNICFPASAPVQTDQGIVAIARLNPTIHTIQGMRIVDVTKTVTNDSFLVRIGRDTLGKDYPVQDTVISRLHKLEYCGQMVASEWFVDRGFAGVERIPYSGEPLYNVILAEPRTMRVNNLVCETLLPSNPIAKLYARSSRYTEYTRDIILSLLKIHTASNDREAYRKVLSSL